MISASSYFGSKIDNPEVTVDIMRNAFNLLKQVNLLLENAEVHDIYSPLNDPDTGTQISGAKGGAGDGGFRLSTSTTGSSRSAHRVAMAIDIYDPENILDNWLTDIKLEVYNLYREHPSSTLGWCHLQTRPASKRTFNP